MITRFALLTMLLLGLAGAAPRKKPVAPPVPLPDLVRVMITTELGPILVELDHKRAPVTVKNFVRYVDAKRLDGTTFYRAMRLDWGTPPNGLVQAGPRGDPTRVYPPIAHEPTGMTGLSHVVGTLSMARFAPGTATADFSILLADMKGLDASAAAGGDPDGYAAFGRVIVGMEVVRKIWDAPTSPTLGEGFLKGQMLEKPVKIVSARRVITPPPAAPTSPAPRAGRE
ncbi:MAG: peptidylprolyl isomerase [Sphingomonadaceae bacterium]